MSDGSINAAGLDARRSSITQVKQLPGRLQTSDHLDHSANDELPSSIPAAIAEESARSGESSFSPRAASSKADTVPPADIPMVPTSTASTQPQADERSRVFIQGRGGVHPHNETEKQPTQLIERSSLNKAGSCGDKFHSARVFPISTGDRVHSGRETEDYDAPASERLSSFADEDHDMASVVSKRLSLHRVHIASQNNSVGAGAGAPSSQQPLDPSIHRMIYFRTKKELSDLFVLAAVSKWERRFNRAAFVLIMVGVADLAIETCDGPNLGSSDPGYPYLPTEADHEIYDGLFAGIFTLEFIIRSIQVGNARAIVRDPYMWIDLIGISPWYILKVLEAMGSEADAEHSINLLRLLRTLRLGLILRHYEQSKIMYHAIKASVRPLTITLFFLFTLVMIIATAIFYAEPCYNVDTCTFTDIFNSAYFVMVTVATVGYGRQVPSLKNPGSLMLTMVAMILGQIYFSMPVAIIGNNFQLTYENFQLDKKRKSRYLDSSLSPFDCQALHNHAKRLCDIQYHLVNAWSVIHSHIHGIARTKTRSTVSMTMDMLESESDRQAKIKEGINRLLEVHAEAVILLQVFLPHRRRSLHLTHDPHSQGLLGNMYAKAKRAMTKAKVTSGHYAPVVDQRTLSQTLRGRLWLILEVPDSSRLATIINQAMVAFALVSVMLFFTESLQELAASGVQTSGCRSVVKSYCSSNGFNKMDPACFLRLENGTSDFTEQLHFSCSSADDSPSCYGNGLNFGTLDASALPCQDAFLTAGANYVCFRQQCRGSVATLFDMGPYWIYFEWYFGIVFTLELGLRFYISQNRKQFWRNFYVFFDVVAIVPFFVEVIEYLSAQIQPDYAIVATSPSFLSVIRVLKIMRILKLTRHFRGTKVLASTAVRVWKPLVIPLFFLFTGCIIAGAVFYEIERGKECFVGETCIWWNKNVLTPELAAGLPLGKRILIQDRVKTTITDMIHSTWLSYTTLTSVGYGDLVPRTAMGKLFSVLVIIVATIYSAMPLSLVGTQFYSLYEKHMEKMIVKQGGSSISWRTKSTITILTQYKTAIKPTHHLSASSPRGFMLSDDQLVLVREFKSMKRTVVNLQRTLEAAISIPPDSVRHRTSVTGRNARASLTPGLRNPGIIDQSIEQKSFAIMDTLLQFSQVVERLQDAPVEFEAFEGVAKVEKDLHTAVYPNGVSPRPPSDDYGELGDTFK